MQQFLNALPLLACPIVMGAMMWWMSRKGHDQPTHTPGAKVDQAAEVARLRAELDQLRAAHQAPAAHGREAVNHRSGSTAPRS